MVGGGGSGALSGHVMIRLARRASSGSLVRSCPHIPTPPRRLGGRALNRFSAIRLSFDPLVSSLRRCSPPPVVQMMTEHDQSSVDGSGGDTKRKSRNQSEKRRRDAFNKLIAELTGIVGDGEKKLDKSNVLKQAIMYLRMQRAAVESTTPEGASTDECSLKFAGTTPKEIGRLYLE
uniref:BHLH domain-containing protein n=1 Tax=Plectus sambesii TaxID=2011161 RepID=A0A914V4J7_9BILA